MACACDTQALKTLPLAKAGLAEPCFKELCIMHYALHILNIKSLRDHPSIGCYAT